MADSSFTCLSTPRLRLRRFQTADLPAFCAYRSDPDVARFQSWDKFTATDGERFLEKQSRLDPDVPGTWFQFAIELVASGILIGDCGLNCKAKDPRQVEIGITLARTYQGLGHAGEALTCLMDYVFFQLHKHRVSAVTDAKNEAAAKMLRRVGFRLEGHYRQNIWFKGQWGDEFSFALLESEWKQKRHKPKLEAP